MARISGLGKADKHPGWDVEHDKGSDRERELFRRQIPLVVILRPGYGVTTENKIELPYNKGKGKAL